MAVQKRRKSSSARDSKRAQWMRSVKVPNVTTCPECGEPKASHRICMKCGTYNKTKVVEVEEAAE
jgi:large subunit ribosomal protein L32